uniref:Uncharacterized protein n=1 Tax=Parascaris equorum TaxID=6256 RepID=A0A914R7V4_PAREQ
MHPLGNSARGDIIWDSFTAFRLLFSVEFCALEWIKGASFLIKRLGERAVELINDSLIANPFVGYSKSDHLAMLAFHVDRVLQQRSTECPLSEAYTVLRLLKAHELRFISSL